MNPTSSLAQAETESTSVRARPSPAGRGWNWDSLSWLAPEVPLRQVICILGAGQDAVAESIRLLYTRLQRLREKRPLKTLMVTSALPQEGKSFLALNLAAVISQHAGSRVLLLEADLRRPSYCSTLGLNPAAGLAEYCGGGEGLAKFVYHIRGADLYLLPAGGTAGRPMDVLSSEGMEQALKEAGKVFDWVLVDSAPLSPVADSALLSQLCDGLLLVVRRNRATHTATREALERINPAQLLGLVLNDFPSLQSTKAYFTRPAEIHGKEPLSILDYRKQRESTLLR